MKRLLTVSMALLALSSPSWADDTDRDLRGQAQEPDEKSVQESTFPDSDGGPKVADLSPGDRAPEFKLQSATGGVVQLSDLKNHASVLIFSTDCSWLGSFGAIDDSLKALGVEQYGVCPNPKRAIEAYAARLKLPFPLLSDPGGAVSQRFGMYDTDAQTIQPGLVLVDAEGVIRMVVQSAPLHPEAVLALLRQATGT